MKKKIQVALISLDAIQDKIYFIREHRVMLDRDLAKLYGVPTKVFNQAVKRNRKRFPDDFMFRLTKEEHFFLRSQFVTLEKAGKGRYSKYPPQAFTEEGVSMLSGVLQSDRAIDVHIAIMRVFAQMRRILATNRELAGKLIELENKLIAHDYQIEDILKAIRKLMHEPRKPKLRIGYLRS